MEVNFFSGGTNVVGIVILVVVVIVVIFIRRLMCQTETGCSLLRMGDTFALIRFIFFIIFIVIIIIIFWVVSNKEKYINKKKNEQ